MKAPFRTLSCISSLSPFSSTTRWSILSSSVSVFAVATSDVEAMVVVCATAAQVFEYRGAICLFRAVMGQVSLYFTVEASSLCHQFLLMFSEGSFLGLHSIYLHGDQVVFSSLPFEGVFPQLFLVFAHFGGLHKSQVVIDLTNEESSSDDEEL